MKKIIIASSLFCILTIIPIATTSTARGGELELLSRSLLEAPVKDVIFLEDTLIICTGSAIAIFQDFRNMQNPVYLPLPEEVQDIELCDKKLYAVMPGAGIMKIDISNPKTPRKEKLIRLAKTEKLICTRKYMILSSREGAIEVFSKGDMKKLSATKLASPVISMKAVSDTLIAFQADRVSIYRIDNGQIELLSHKKFPHKLRKAVIQDEILLAVTKEKEFFVARITRKANLQIQNWQKVLKNIIDFDINKSIGVALEENGKLVSFTMAIKNQAQEPQVEIKFGKKIKLATGRKKLPFFKNKRKEIWRRVILSGNSVAALSPTFGIYTLKITNNIPFILSSYELRGFAIDLVAHNNFLYLANGRDGVRIGKIEENGNIDWIGHFPSSEARDIAVFRDSILVLADGRDGIKTIDISEPSKPSLIARKGSPFFQSAVVVDDNWAYIAGGLSGAEVYNISKPSNIKLIWRKKLSEVRGIDIDGKFLYIADGQAGFRIYSLTKDKPEKVSRFDTPGWNSDCFISGEIAYLTDGFHGLKIIDISNRYKPVQLGQINIGFLTRELHAVGSTVFIAAHVGGLFVIDAGDPRNPTISARFDSADDARGVFADRKFIYLASGSGGVYIFRYTE